MFETMTAGEVQTLNIVIKATFGVHLRRSSLHCLTWATKRLRVNVVAGGVGGITETDISLAITSNAVIFGFNTRADAKARGWLKMKA